jgi:WD40 repeat protein
LVSIASNGSLSAATRDGGFKVWDIESGEMRVAIDGGTTPCAIAVVGDGTIGVAADSDGVIKLWDLSSGQLIREMLSNDLQHRRNGASKSTEASRGYFTPYLSLTPDGKCAVIVNSDPPHPRRIEFWDLEKGSCQPSDNTPTEAIDAFRDDCRWLLPVLAKTHDAQLHDAKTLSGPYVVIGNRVFVSVTTFMNPVGSIWGPKRSIFMLDSGSLAV